MNEENLQKDIKEEVKENTNKQEFMRIFGICKLCDETIGLDLDGDYVACEHHPQSVVKENLKEIINKVNNKEPIEG